MRRFFIDKDTVSSTVPTLTGPDVRHIRTVLHLKAGDEIFLFDGQGSEYRARIADSTSRAIRLLILDKYSAISESRLEIEIAQSLLKARNMDRIVRQLTELGVVAFLPFMSERSVPRPEPSRLAGRKQRWKTIARESLKQCGRSRTPHIGSLVSFEELVTARRSHNLKVIFHNHQSGVESTSCLAKMLDVRSVLALVGPEGGFTDDEVELALQHGFVCVCLGPRTLKSDTAAIIIAAILQHTFGDLADIQKNLDKD